MHSRGVAEPYVTEFESTVERIDGREVVLSETYFYPASGGQPADRGSIAGQDVADLRVVDDEVVHELAAEPAVGEGATVTGTIDSEFRTYCMRAHTASHALYGAARSLLADLGYGGFDISPEKVRVDFETTTDVDDDTLVELQRLVNRVVWESRPVSWEQVPREEALAREDVAFNTKTEEGITGRSQVRLVEIDDWDVAACGGTHVRNTGEIGPVTVLDRSNPGEGHTRVEFAVGPTAIDRWATEASALRGAARSVGVPPTELPDAVARLCEERDALDEQVQDLRGQVIEARLADLEGATVSREGVEWLAGRVPSADANALAEFAQRLLDRTAEVVALVGEDGTYVAVASDGTVDANSVVTALTDRFGGGGGGNETVAQAGGLDADAADVVAFLRGN